MVVGDQIDLAGLFWFFPNDWFCQMCSPYCRVVCVCIRLLCLREEQRAIGQLPDRTSRVSHRLAAMDLATAQVPLPCVCTPSELPETERKQAASQLQADARCDLAGCRASQDRRVQAFAKQLPLTESSPHVTKQVLYDAEQQDLLPQARLFSSMCQSRILLASASIAL